MPARWTTIEPEPLGPKTDWVRKVTCAEHVNGVLDHHYHWTNAHDSSSGSWRKLVWHKVSARVCYTGATGRMSSDAPQTARSYGGQPPVLPVAEGGSSSLPMAVAPPLPPPDQPALSNVPAYPSCYWSNTLMHVRSLGQPPCMVCPGDDNNAPPLPPPGQPAAPVDHNAPPVAKKRKASALEDVATHAPDPEASSRIASVVPDVSSSRPESQFIEVIDLDSPPREPSESLADDDLNSPPREPSEPPADEQVCASVKRLK